MLAGQQAPTLAERHDLDLAELPTLLVPAGLPQSQYVSGIQVTIVRGQAGVERLFAGSGLY